MAATGTDGRWTLDKQGRFLESLAATCNVAKSLRAVKMTKSGVYKLRMKSPAFREAWEGALREGYARLELLLLEQAINGTTKEVWHGGAKVGERVEHDLKLALMLLQAHGKTIAAVRDRPPPPGDAAITALLGERFDDMAERMGIASEA